jgi:hypothetical protein
MICADGYITHAVDTEPPVFDDNYPNIIHAVPQIYYPAQQAQADTVQTLLLRIDGKIPKMTL